MKRWSRSLGFEPRFSAWTADVLPLNYNRVLNALYSNVRRKSRQNAKLFMNAHVAVQWYG